MQTTDASTSGPLTHEGRSACQAAGRVSRASGECAVLAADGHTTGTGCRVPLSILSGLRSAPKADYNLRAALVAEAGGGYMAHACEQD